MKRNLYIFLLLSYFIFSGCGKVEIRGRQKLDVQIADLQRLGQAYDQLSSNQRDPTTALKELGFQTVLRLQTTNVTFRLSHKGCEYFFGIEDGPDNHTVVACSGTQEKQKPSGAPSGYVITAPGGGYSIVRSELPPVPGCLFEANQNGKIVALSYPPSAMERFAVLYPQSFDLLRSSNGRVTVPQN